MSDLVKRSQDIQITTDSSFRTIDDVYDLRRQLDQREVVKDFLRAEILRMQQLMDQLTQEQTLIDLKLNTRNKPAGEPRNKRYLYAPEELHKYLPLRSDSTVIEGEVSE